MLNSLNLLDKESLIKNCFEKKFGKEMVMNLAWFSTHKNQDYSAFHCWNIQWNNMLVQKRHANNSYKIEVRRCFPKVSDLYQALSQRTSTKHQNALLFIPETGYTLPNKFNPFPTLFTCSKTKLNLPFRSFKVHRLGFFCTKFSTLVNSGDW